MEKEWIPRIQGLDFVELFKERGIDEKDIPKFVRPLDFCNEKNPRDFYNMETAVGVARDFLENGANVLVIADVDADGVTSGCIIYNTLRKFFPNNNIDILIGERKVHGIRQQNFETMSKYDLLIACDSGSDEHDIYKKLTENNTTVILLDHHGTEIEDENAIVVNPEMHPVTDSDLSGAGVCLKFVELMFEEEKNFVPPYDLATLGIIADVMDMTKEDNRAICSKGFINIYNKGIIDTLNGYKFNSEAVDFTIAPLVNAAQRLNKNETALRLFKDDTSPQERRDVLEELKDCKSQQKIYAESMVGEMDIIENEKFVFASTPVDEDKAGLCGLIANRLSGIYQKPTIVVQKNKKESRGSMRTYGFDNFKTAINDTGLAVSQGHEGAAGVYIDNKNIEPFLLSLEKNLPDGIKKQTIVDCELDDINDLTMSDVEFIDRVNEVTGYKFPKISLMISNVKPRKVFAMKNKHTKIVCDHADLIFWNNIKPVEDWQRNKWKSFDIVGVPTISRYGKANRINIILSDIDYEVVN